MAAPTPKTAALKVPILPEHSPEAPQPKGLKLLLHPHQLRALHRCLLIEFSSLSNDDDNNDSSSASPSKSLSEDFGQIYNFKSRGGCLADAVGVGKTATILGLILDGMKGNGGDTLVVAPGHLIPQWKHEIEKFIDHARVEVVVGKAEYDAKSEERSYPSCDHSKIRIVLMDVNTIIHEEKLWYNFRRVFTEQTGRQIRATADEIAAYRIMALYCVKSAYGPCGYDGWIYPGTLHNPSRPWRRIIFDEIQDLVSDGTESQKNLLQLSRTAQNVWLLSATPFPFGNKSVYANHELLGFCRLRLNVEVDQPLPHNHTFEIIKRKLYIRSPRRVVDLAVTASKKVTRNTVIIQPTALEKKFYQLEMEEYCAHSDDKFSNDYSSLRQMMVHPEASKRLREQINGNKKQNHHSTSTTAIGRFSSVDSFALSSLSQAKACLNQLTSHDLPLAVKQLHSSRMSTNLAMKVRLCRKEPRECDPFSRSGGATTPSQTAQEAEAATIHSYYCPCSKYGSTKCIADSAVNFRIIVNADFSGPETICGIGSTRRVVTYFQTQCGPNKRVNHGRGTTDALDHYILCSEQTTKLRNKAITKLYKENTALNKRIEALEATASVGSKSGSGIDEAIDELAASHGSKSAALIRYLVKIQDSGEKSIVFSYWHDTLRLIWNTLRKCGLRASFCDGDSHSMSQAIKSFASEPVNILLLSAQAKASGANLQVATHVVLLDPAGSSAEHGAALEQQAIGRAVRMGQNNPVTVTRFCVKASVEVALFADIDAAAAKLEERNSDSSYLCENASLQLKLTVNGDNQEDDENGIIITESISVNERVARNVASAKENDTVIEILDDETLSLPLKFEFNADNQMGEKNIIRITESMHVNERVPRSTASSRMNVTGIEILDDDDDDVTPSVPILTVSSAIDTAVTKTESAVKAEFPAVARNSSIKIESSKRSASTPIYDTPVKRVKTELTPNIIEPSPIMNRRKNSPSSFELKVGSLVKVEARSSPGINQEGGVGKVTAIRHHGIITNCIHTVQYSVDVKYILGGKEKNIDVEYIHEHSFDCDDSSKNTRRLPRK